MTLTAPGCPVAGEMPVWVENAAGTVEGVQDVKVNLVFDPAVGPQPHVGGGSRRPQYVVE
jgi:metal-sulfur cluster biosynthetic enzyme